MGLKPIFKEEQDFFYRKSGVKIPNDCWRDGHKIFLDTTNKTPLYVYAVDTENDKIVIKKDNSKKLEGYIQKTIDDLIAENTNKLNDLYNESVNNLYNYVVNNLQQLYIISNSTGKDSDLTYYIWIDVLKKIYDEDIEKYNKIEWVINFANTSNDTADTYLKIKSMPKSYIDKLNLYPKLDIMNPEIGWSKWLVDVKNYFIPSTMVRNCCSTYKEGQLKTFYDKNRNITNVIGVRYQESAKRKDYVFEMNYEWKKKHFGNSNLPANWNTIAPIVQWSDIEVWLYILHKKN